MLAIDDGGGFVRLRLLIVLVVLAVLSVACGGSSDSGEAGQDATTQGPTDSGEDARPDDSLPVDDPTPTSTVPASTAPPVDDPDGSIRAAAIAAIEQRLVPGDGPNMTADQKTCFGPLFVDELGLGRIVELGFTSSAIGDPFTDGSLHAAEEDVFVDLYFACVDAGEIIASLALGHLDVPADAVACMDEAVAADDTLRDELRASVFGGDPPGADLVDRAMGIVVTGCLPPDLVSQLTP